MKKLITILILLVSLVAWAAETTVTLTKTDTRGDGESYSFTFADGATDSIYVDFGSLTIGDNNDDGILFYWTSGEATADSIRWTVHVQGKSYPSESTWKTITTYADTNSTSPFIHAYNALTSGSFPYMRLWFIGADGDLTAEQTITGYIVIDKDP